MPTPSVAELLRTRVGLGQPPPDRLHVCFLCDEYPPGRHGGVGSSTQTMARSLVARGHRATVIGVSAVRRRTVEMDRGVQVIRLPHARLRGTGVFLNGARRTRELHRTHRAHPIDVIEGPEISLATLWGRVPAPTIIRMNGGHHFFSSTLGFEQRSWVTWLERRSFARANHLCAVSRFVAETTRELLGLGDQPIAILPNPVESELFGRASAVLEEEGLIVFVGTVCEKKGVRQLLDALPTIVAAVPNARLLIVGPDSRERGTNRSYIRFLQGRIPAALSSHVSFEGPVERAKLPGLLARASVCVYPSHMEAMGLVIAEAMLAGKAVVAGNAGPGPELIDDGESGLLCDPRDAGSIARQVITALRDPERRRRWGACARARAHALYSDTTQAARNEAFYRWCIGAERRA